MITLALQTLVTLLLFAFGAVALLNGTLRNGSAENNRMAWYWTGVGFCIFALNNVVQDAWAIAAFTAGSESGLWAAYIRLAPAANHSRGFALPVFYLGLLLFSLKPEGGKRRVWLFGSALVAAMVAGGLFGIWEGPIEAAIHFVSVSVVDSIGLVLLLVVLLVLLVRDATDRYLWAALAMHGCKVALGTLLIIAMSRLEIDGAWYPHPAWMPFWRACLVAVMIGLAVRRYLLVRGGGMSSGMISGPIRPRVTLR